MLIDEIEAERLVIDLVHTLFKREFFNYKGTFIQEIRREVDYLIGTKENSMKISIGSVVNQHETALNQSIASLKQRISEIETWLQEIDKFCVLVKEHITEKGEELND